MHLYLLKVNKLVNYLRVNHSNYISRGWTNIIKASNYAVSHKSSNLKAILCGLCNCFMTETHYLTHNVWTEWTRHILTCVQPWSCVQRCVWVVSFIRQIGVRVCVCVAGVIISAKPCECVRTCTPVSRWSSFLSFLCQLQMTGLTDFPAWVPHICCMFSAGWAGWVWVSLSLCVTERRCVI